MPVFLYDFFKYEGMVIGTSPLLENLRLSMDLFHLLLALYLIECVQVK